MPNDFPQTPESWVERSNEFLDVAQKPENAGVFGVDTAKLADQKAQTTVVSDLVDEREAAQEQLKALNAQLRVETPKLETMTRANLGSAAKSSASAELKSDAGVTIPKPRVKAAPKVPLELMATPNTNGTAFLKWKRNGNTTTTKFVVEKRIGNAGWVLVDVVTAISLTVDAKVGEHAAFRVSARNGQGTSEPSNETVIYDI